MAELLRELHDWFEQEVEAGDESLEVWVSRIEPGGRVIVITCHEGSDGRAGMKDQPRSLLRRGKVLAGKIEVVRGHKMVVATVDGQRWSADVDSSFVQRPK